MDADGWVSLREFARRRGVSLTAVQKAIESGRVTAVRRDEHNRLVAIEADLATAQWNANTDPAEAAKSGTVLDVGAEASVVDPTDALPAPSGGAVVNFPRDPEGYYKARAQRERFAALEAERVYLKAIGDLVSRGDLERVNAQRYRAVRDKLLNIADRVAAALAAEKDPARVHAELTKEIKRVLQDLSDKARGVASSRKKRPKHPLL